MGSIPMLLVALRFALAKDTSLLLFPSWSQAVYPLWPSLSKSYANMKNRFVLECHDKHGAKMVNSLDYPSEKTKSNI